jgi:hypothetical protein
VKEILNSFEVTPPTAKFTNFELNNVYHTTLAIQNTSSIGKRVVITPPNDK